MYRAHISRLSRLSRVYRDYLVKFEKQTLSAFYSLSLRFGAKVRVTCFEVQDTLYNFVSDSKLVGGRGEGENWS